ncbi:FxsB family radical SAM/SPASM domain protein [Actinomadura sp. ATCC 31491]|uniref:FxsB family radical SAM/SPASM domain protein n=1 Tax=Actinomadura luzonensis TaxID=2805427 RepID=A0ABT0G149_9ACTN|nr:FxsB family cyclophane-forming radical SAM/SPASM peptide maturase [Actinomadura luzonensis]MCK2217843.1 FxsB family radical SAM/SPASM domain protein [Actinomadura luzonensis]
MGEETGPAATDGGVEWPADLDVDRLLESGWRPTPFRQFILKLHSRCNLACDYCYMYEMADQGWRSQPRRMSKATIDRVAARVEEHARAHGLETADVILHGGEPLLAGVEHVRYAVTALRKALDGIELTVRTQTNGVLLNEAFLRLFAEMDIRVGVSLDGDEEGNDRHRRRASGQSAYARVTAGLTRLTQPAYRHLFGGLLCTIDLDNDPVATFDALLEFEPPMLDFLLPHGNWRTPPPGWTSTGTPYGDWLAAVFDRWYAASQRETQVRLFSQIIRLLCGLPSRSESVGLSPVAIVVVETDGSIEQVDTLKSAYEGAAGTRLHTFRDSFDAALLLPAIAARQIGPLALSDTCAACDLARVCGGGLYPHRYRPGTGFRNPSVYCRDLYRLITHIRRAIGEDVALLTGPAGRPAQAATAGQGREGQIGGGSKSQSRCRCSSATTASGCSAPSVSS